jgi:hypothetical protein
MSAVVLEPPQNHHRAFIVANNIETLTTDLSSEKENDNNTNLKSKFPSLNTKIALI